MKWNKYTLEYGYSLDDICKKVNNGVVKLDSIPAFTRIFGYLFTSAPTTYWTGTGTGKTLWEYVYIKNFDGIIAVDPDGDINHYQAICRNFGKRFYGIWETTHEYYEKLLTIYTAQANNLFSQITSTSSSTNRFNDTPQESGLFDDDNHSTNITQVNNTVTTDPGTVMSRLDEIKNKLFTIYSDWAKRFNELFISGLNYEEVDDNE